MNWFDLMIALIMVWSMWRGLATGLVSGLARLLGLILGLTAALSYNRVLAEHLNNLWNLEKRISGWIPGLSLPSASVPAGESARNIETVAAWQEKWNLTGSWPGSLSRGIGDISDIIGDAVGALLARGLLEVISFVLIFLAVSWAVQLAGGLIAKIASFTFFGPVDRIGGLLFGLIRGTLIVLIILALLVPLQLPFAVAGGLDGENWLSGAVKDSTLLPVFQHLIDTLHLKWPGLPVNLQEGMENLTATIREGQ